MRILRGNQLRMLRLCVDNDPPVVIVLHSVVCTRNDAAAVIDTPVRIQMAARRRNYLHVVRDANRLRLLLLLGYRRR